MKGKWMMLAACILTALPVPALAAGQTGNEFLAECTGSAAIDLGHCIGFIVGFQHGWEMADQNLRAFCRPQSTGGQSMAVVVKYLNDHPDRRHAPTPFLVLLALHEAWPCPNGGSVTWLPQEGTIRALPPAKR